MASTSRVRVKKKAKKHKNFDVGDEEDEQLLFDMPMDFEKEEVIDVSFASVTDPFLSKLGQDQYEFYNERDESIDHDIPHLDEDENYIVDSVLVHDPTKEWNVMEPKYGEKYHSLDQLKICLVNYVVTHGFPLRFEKLESTRLLAKCGRDKDKKKCPYGSWMNTERTIQVKSLNTTHLCARTFKFGHLVSPEWIASHLVKEIILKPSIKLRELKEFIKNKFRITLTTSKCHRAKEKAMVMIEGKIDDHYARIWDYGEEIKRSNPGSSVEVNVKRNPDGKSYFHRFYVCFHALKTGWIHGCRQVIGLDGCFLKGQIKGELLTAIGRDANNQVYPICWAVVDVENKNNWRWFLELLIKDLGLQLGGGVTVISDQHKGLLEAVKELLPNAEHRQCARHIYVNFKKAGYNGEEYKHMFWAAASCTVEPEFLEVMERLKAIDVGAYEDLMSRNPSSWCRAYFIQDRACEAFENGISESFNAMIIDARKRPLLTMLEMIRLSVMERVSTMHKKFETWHKHAPVCPAIIKKLENFGEHYRLWSVFSSGRGLFETRSAYASYRVDLQSCHCTCRLWGLSGVPCVHAIAAMYYDQQYPEDFISPWFSTEKFKESYSTFLQPVNGSNLWHVTPFDKPLPPMSRRMPGRPTINRKRHASENDNKRSGKRTVKCNNCQEFGHNKLSCKNPSKEPDPKPKKKIGRPTVEKIVRTAKKPRKTKEKSKEGPKMFGSDWRASKIVEKEGPIENQERLSSYDEAVLDLKKSGYNDQEIEELMSTMYDEAFDNFFDAPGLDETQEIVCESLFDVPIVPVTIDEDEEERVEETVDPVRPLINLE